jgi:hypothetical protein
LQAQIATVGPQAIGSTIDFSNLASNFPALIKFTAKCHIGTSSFFFGDSQKWVIVEGKRFLHLQDSGGLALGSLQTVGTDTYTLSDSSVNAIALTINANLVSNTIQVQFTSTYVNVNGHSNNWTIAVEVIQ